MPGTGASYRFVGPDGNETTKYTESTPLEEQLQDALAYFRGSGNPVIVGHSQGGMRAFALAKLRKEVGQNTTGVISIGGPVKGFSPLAGGVEQLKSRIVGVMDDLLRGADALYSAALLGLPVFPGAAKSTALALLKVFTRKLMDH
jgi:pimeloyl-ACP methyl ester carboxylesterase